MKGLLLSVAMAAMGTAAHAATIQETVTMPALSSALAIDYSEGGPLGGTARTLNGQANGFDTSLGTLNSVSVTYYGRFYLAMTLEGDSGVFDPDIGRATYGFAANAKIGALTVATANYQTALFCDDGSQSNLPNCPSSATAFVTVADTITVTPTYWSALTNANALTTRVEISGTANLNFGEYARLGISTFGPQSYYRIRYNYTPAVTQPPIDNPVVPLPASGLLTLSALAGMVGLARRRRR